MALGQNPIAVGFADDPPSYNAGRAGQLPTLLKWTEGLAVRVPYIGEQADDAGQCAEQHR
jgi:hypothetical protein